MPLDGSFRQPLELKANLAMVLATPEVDWLMVHRSTSHRSQAVNQVPHLLALLLHPQGPAVAFVCQR